MTLYSCYRRVWAVDFEFTAPLGERPTPICLVGRELHTGELRRTWLADGAPSTPPYDTGADTLFVAYYASAELGCHLALGWPLPVRVLDLYAEFRNLTSGLPVPCGRGLIGALIYHGLDALNAADKSAMRELAMRGRPFTEMEQQALLDYCQSDVDAVAQLLPVMLPQIDLPRALLRGRYVAAVAKMEWVGVPIDVDTLRQLRKAWPWIKSRLIAAVDADYGVFVPAGHRHLDSETAFDAAVLQAANAWRIDPHQLACAARVLCEDELDNARAINTAHRVARKVTGFTPRQIEPWEDTGRDHADYLGLGVTAGGLTDTYPAPEIGREYPCKDSADKTHNTGCLSEVLHNRNETTRPPYDAEMINQAVELVRRAGLADYRPMTFSAERWANYLICKGIPWPRLPSGSLALDDDTFREMARAYPVQVSPIRELRHVLSQLRLTELAVGTDARNRVLLSVFGSRTGRNQPSNSRFIFGPSTWLRSLIKPEAGRAVAYVDWSQQELAIAAALSGDRRMQDAYTSGDFYLTFAKMAGAVPPDATKQTHGNVRDQFKTVALGVLYGLSAEGLARKLSITPIKGRELLRMHRETFLKFWNWSDRIEMEAMLSGRLRTVYGWMVHVGGDANPRSLRNFPMQAHGAEMLRLACCLATERGITVCCPVHDALLVEGAVDRIDDVVAQTQAAMEEASELVLPGFPLRTEAKVVKYPDRYGDERGRRMWETVSGLLAELDGPQTSARMRGI